MVFIDTHIFNVTSIEPEKLKSSLFVCPKLLIKNDLH